MEKSKILEALDSIEDGLLIANRDFVIEYANNSARKLLRIENIEGKHTYEAIWGREKNEGKSPGFITFETGSTSSAEKTFDDGTCLNVRTYSLGDDHLAVTIWDITDYVSLEKRLQDSGNDPVTGLRSGNSFAKDLEKELDRAKRSRSGLALMILELGAGNSEGERNYEEILSEIAGILVDAARNYDLIYRFQSDTFGIIMPHCPIEGATKTTERILNSIRKKFADVRPSIGISSSETAFTGRDILRLAERALYVAKHRGGDTYVVG